MRDAGDERSKLHRRLRQVAFVAPDDDCVRDAARSTFFAVLKDDVRKFALRRADQNIVGTASGVWIHTHIERCVFAKRKAALRFI